MNRVLMRLVCVVGLVLWVGVACPAHAQITRQSHRLKKLYDFEGTDDRGVKVGFAGTLMPRNWYAIGRRALGEKEAFHALPLHRRLENLQGYPRHTKIGYDRKEKVSGDFSLKLGLSGGQTGAYIQHAAVGVKAQSDYRVSVKVLTRDLEYAWAELHAYFIDSNGKRIEASVQRSEPIVTHGEWKDVSVKLPGDFNNAAYLGIELHIRQPSLDVDDPLGNHQVVVEDISGAAWFDDVAVWELPSVTISTGVPTNVITANHPPTLHARVRDLTGRRLRAVVQVYDHAYQPVDRVEDAIGKAGWSWTPDLKGRYGWYWADLSIYESNSAHELTRQVARTLTGFLWLSPVAAPGDDRPRFMLVAEDTPTKQLPLVAQLLNQAKLTGLVVSGWEPGGSPSSTTARARVIEPIVRDLIVRRGSVAVSFWPVPVELAARAGTETKDPLATLSKPADKWIDYAKPFLSPLGQRMNRWQVGSPTRPNAFLSRDLAGDLTATRNGIRTAAPSPTLIVPWRLDQPNRSSELPPGDRYAIAWPQGVKHDRLAEALEGWPTPPSNIRIDIELADAADMTHERRVADLMLRVLHAWEYGVDAIGLPRPWAQTFERHTSITPDPVLGAWVTLSQQLEGQRVIGRMPLARGLNAMILDGRQGGMLAVWNERAETDPVELSLYLGESPTAVDPFGNTTPILANDDGKHTIVVTQTPTIIRGIDPRLALMRAGFKLDEPFIESLQVAHRRTLKIYNPWPRTMNGYYIVTGPDRWTIQPQRRQLSIAPGATAEVPLALRFPIFESGGYKQLTAEFVFNVGQDFNVTLQTPMEVGLHGVDFEADVIVEPGKQAGTFDAIVTLSVTNTGDKRQTLNTFAGLQGHARRERILPGIAPGEFISRRIRFKNVDAQIGKAPIRCGVREANGPAVLNHTLQLIPPRQNDVQPPAIAEVEVP